MRPQDILMPVPAGLCCKPGGFHIDPVRPVERAVITHGHSDHARAGHGAVLATQETLDMMRLRYGDNFAGTTQAIALWRGDQARRRHRQIPSGRPCAGLGADRGVLQGHLHRRLRRLQGRARSDLRAVRSGALRRLHHRGDVRPAGVPPWRCRGRGEEAAGLGRAVSGARASGRRLFARQGAARDRAVARRPATTRRSTCMARWRRSRIITRAAASRSASCARQGREEGRSRRHHHAGAADRRPRISGRGASPIRSRRSRRAGCGCAPARGSAASNCRW